MRSLTSAELSKLSLRSCFELLRTLSFKSHLSITLIEGSVRRGSVLSIGAVGADVIILVLCEGDSVELFLPEPRVRHSARRMRSFASVRSSSARALS